jgi:predicted dehydrogenase
MPSTAPSRLRVAVIGCGAVTERYHLPALLASPDVEVTVLVDPAVERARLLAARAGTSAVLANHQELPRGINLAVVAVPNAYHEPVASELLRRGIHVLVEKPMARSVAECDAMLSAAASKGALLAIGHDFRHFPVARYAHDLFRTGLLGPVQRVDVRQSSGLGWPAVSDAVLARESGGGILMDFGIHILDLLLWWLGDLRVLAYRDDAAGGVESECECELVLTSGAPARIDLSRTRALRDTVIVECERGTVELGVFDPAVIRLSAPGLPALGGILSDPEFEGAPMRTIFARQLDDLVTAIRQGRQPLVPGAQGRRAVALVEDCYRARQPLQYPWDFPNAYALLAGRDR